MHCAGAGTHPQSGASGSGPAAERQTPLQPRRHMPQLTQIASPCSTQRFMDTHKTAVIDVAPTSIPDNAFCSRCVPILFDAVLQLLVYIRNDEYINGGTQCQPGKPDALARGVRGHWGSYPVSATVAVMRVRLTRGGRKLAVPVDLTQAPSCGTASPTGPRATNTEAVALNHHHRC
jgi:hypothetical protein